MMQGVKIKKIMRISLVLENTRLTDEKKILRSGNTKFILFLCHFGIDFTGLR
jgi:hypothetical protein